MSIKRYLVLLIVLVVGLGVFADGVTNSVAVGEILSNEWAVDEFDSLGQKMATLSLRFHDNDEIVSIRTARVSKQPSEFDFKFVVEGEKVVIFYSSRSTPSYYMGFQDGAFYIESPGSSGILRNLRIEPFAQNAR